MKNICTSMRKLSKELELEAKSFEQKIKEKVKNGLIPDLRRAVFCEWFYNNPWRYPVFVDWSFSEFFRFYLSVVEEKTKQVLEVGCEQGNIALELAMKGHNVNGIDISKEAIKIAKKRKKQNQFKKNMGNLNYFRCDYFSFSQRKKYDFSFFSVIQNFKD